MATCEKCHKHFKVMEDELPESFSCPYCNYTQEEEENYCPSCNGEGEVRAAWSSAVALEPRMIDCPDCGGTGLGGAW